MIVVGWGLIITGLFIIFSGIIGLFRFPNFYTKIHAAGLIDACGIPLCLIGLALLQSSSVNSLKLIIATGFILLLGPVATHALARASLTQNNDNILDPEAKEGKSNV